MVKIFQKLLFSFLIFCGVFLIGGNAKAEILFQQIVQDTQYNYVGGSYDMVQQFPVGKLTGSITQFSFIGLKSTINNNQVRARLFDKTSGYVCDEIAITLTTTPTKYYVDCVHTFNVTHAYSLVFQNQILYNFATLGTNAYWETNSWLQTISGENSTARTAYFQMGSNLELPPDGTLTLNYPVEDQEFLSGDPVNFSGEFVNSSGLWEDFVVEILEINTSLGYYYTWDVSGVSNPMVFNFNKYMPDGSYSYNYYIQYKGEDEFGKFTQYNPGKFANWDNPAQTFSVVGSLTIPPVGGSIGGDPVEMSYCGSLPGVINTAINCINATDSATPVYNSIVGFLGSFLFPIKVYTSSFSSVFSTNDATNIGNQMANGVNSVFSYSKGFDEIFGNLPISLLMSLILAIYVIALIIKVVKIIRLAKIW